MRVPVQPMSPGVLVRLVNEWGSRPRTEAGEQDMPYPDPATLREGAGIPPGLWPDLADDRTLRRAADRLHPVFAAARAPERVELAAGLLAATGVRPTLTLASGQPAAAWLVDDGREAVLAAAALALRHRLAEHGPGRLGVCAGQACADAYIDASPSGRRRFCSVTCQNRTRVAAWRSRRATRG